MPWIKVSERLPLHKAHWNTGKTDAHDNDFPVRQNGRYAMGNIYDERRLHDKEPKYTINFEGKEHFENEFDEIEWLDESEPDQENLLWDELFEYYETERLKPIKFTDIREAIALKYTLVRK